MKTRIIGVHTTQPQPNIITEASDLLKAGNVVAFPTETVYGLGTRLSDVVAIKKIFEAKHRPADNPLIAHVASREQVENIAHVTSRAKKLIQQFWPGPLTLVLKKKSTVPDIATAGLQTVCVRMPSHKVALALIEAVGEPIVAPSANTSGAPSPTTARHVYDDLQGVIPLILDGGACTVGLESTVLNLTSDPPCILRPGAVTFEQLQSFIPNLENPSLNSPSAKGRKQEGFTSPGMKYRHYAPKAKLILVTLPLYKKSRPRNLVQSQKTFLLPQIKKILESYQRKHKNVAVLNLTLEKNLTHAARNLFAKLRAFDQQSVDAIIVYGVKESGLGVAIMNRLRKAATRIIT